MSWYKEKIKGDFAEAICKSHFSAIGYHVENTGVESAMETFARYSNLSSNKSIPADMIMDNIRFTPDLLISRLYQNTLQSFYIEVKYRQKVEDLQILENELFWQYRKIIWDENILKLVKANDQEIQNWDRKPSSKKEEDPFDEALLEKIKGFKDKYKYIKTPIIFYLVVKEPCKKEHVYCNFATFPEWWELGDKRYDKDTGKTYRSTNSLYNKDFNDVYYSDIKPALNEIFG